MNTLTPYLQDALGSGWTIAFTALRVAAVFIVLLLFIRVSESGCWVNSRLSIW